MKTGFSLPLLLATFAATLPGFAADAPAGTSEPFTLSPSPLVAKSSPLPGCD